jgi:peptide/nickel transport system permease protein
MVGLAILLLLVFLALFGRALAPYGYNDQRLEAGQVNRPPGWPHLLGTDGLGRDVLSRLLYGARTALGIGLLVVGADLLLGLTIGALAGYRGGWLDDLLMRLTDIVLAFPGLLLAIMIVSVLGPGLLNVFIALGIAGWPAMARLVRGQVLSSKEHNYVLAARAMGASDRRIILRHVLPNCLGPVVVAVSLSLGGAILAEASLSFIGIGARAPAPSWGGMINEAMSEWRTAPHLVLAPGAAIALVVLAFNALGDGLNEALDPRRH